MGKRLVRKKPDRSPLWRIAKICAIPLLVIIIAFFIIGIVAAKNQDVWPNVSMSGISLGGLDYAEAVEKLDENNYKSSYTNSSLEVVIPGDIRIDLTAQEAGIVLTTQDAAQYAVNYGKSGSFFTKAFSYIKSAFSKTDLQDGEYVTFKDNDIRIKIQKAVNQFTSNVSQEAYRIENERLIIVKGAKGIALNPNEILALIKSSFEPGKKNSVKYTPVAKDSDNLNIEEIHNTVFTEPVSAVYDFETGEVTESVIGIDFDQNDAKRRFDAAKNGETVIIQLIYTDPEISSEELRELLFRDVIAQKSTTLAGSSSNRTNNIDLASREIDGLVLNPGDVFSFNGVVGQRTSAKGYKASSAYANGEVVQEVGGGICQVASTLYYCTLISDLEVVFRDCHMFTVGYLPLGMDATVNWGTIDYKFKNDTQYPIKIECNVSGGYLNVKFIGTKLDDKYIEMDYVVVDVIGYNTVEKEDASVPAGQTVVKSSGTTGYVVNTYKYIYDGNGNLLSKTFEDESVYSKADRVILIPIGGLNPPETPTDTETPTPTDTGTPTPTDTETPTPTDTDSPSPTDTGSPSPTDTGTGTG
jgi:vancomycin resistance protein YoaR